MALEPVTIASLRRGAYRTLGLCASATQSMIDGAARRMRIWPDPSKIPPTPWDIPLLGEIHRTKADIEAALALLREPRSRLRERLLWFHGSGPPVSAGVLRDPPARAADRHDAAVLELQQVLSNELSHDTAARWNHIFHYFDQLAGGPDGLSFLLEFEQAGGFEKRATPDELRVALDSQPVVLAGGLAEQSRAALMSNRWDIGTRLASLLKGRDGLASREVFEKLLDQLEDALARRCREADQALRDALRTNHQNPEPFYAQNLGPAHQAHAAYRDSIRPLIAVLSELSKDDAHRHQRIRAQSADFVTLLALGWEWSNQMINALDVLNEALELLRGTQGEQQVRQALHRVWPLAENQRQNRGKRESQEILLKQPAQGSFASQSPILTTFNLSSVPKRQKSKVKRPLSVTTGLVIAISIFVRMLITGSSSWHNEEPMNPMATPSFRNLDLAHNQKFNLTPTDKALHPFAELYSNVSLQNPGPATRPSPFGESNREQ